MSSGGLCDGAESSANGAESSAAARCAEESRARITKGVRDVSGAPYRATAACAGKPGPARGPRLRARWQRVRAAAAAGLAGASRALPFRELPVNEPLASRQRSPGAPPPSVRWRPVVITRARRRGSRARTPAGGHGRECRMRSGARVSAFDSLIARDCAVQFGAVGPRYAFASCSPSGWLRAPRGDPARERATRARRRARIKRACADAGGSIVTPEPERFDVIRGLFRLLRVRRFRASPGECPRHARGDRRRLLVSMHARTPGSA